MFEKLLYMFEKLSYVAQIVLCLPQALGNAFAMRSALALPLGMSSCFPRDLCMVWMQVSEPLFLCSIMLFVQLLHFP